MSVLELRNISKRYGAIQALNNVSLAIEPGEVVGLMGDNGAGKSTLVKVIAGNFAPTSGDVLSLTRKWRFINHWMRRKQALRSSIRILRSVII